MTTGHLKYSVRAKKVLNLRQNLNPRSLARLSILFIPQFHNRNNLKDKDPLKAHIEARKAIVFIDSLLLLFTVCREPGCSSAIDPSNVKVVETGATVSVKYTCNGHHMGTWHGSQFRGEVPI